MPAKLYAINHRPGGTGIFGGIHEEFICGRDDSGVLDPRYADMRAPYHIWQNVGVPDIVGFHGYRKHIDFVSGQPVGGTLAKGWHEVDLKTFQEYQLYIVKTEFDKRLAAELEDYDLLTVEPFDCSYNGNMAVDYRRSRSGNDWDRVAIAMSRRGVDPGATSFIRPMHFVSRAEIFHQFMRFWDDARQEFEPWITSEDAKDPAYPPRALAYLSERIWSLWVDSANLRIKTFPLYICWEAT